MVSPVLARAMDLILHPACGPRAECVQHSARCGWPDRPVPTRSPASPPASPALWGPAHGGANEAVLKMLNEIGHARPNIPAFIEKVKDPHSHVRLMGFGHRVYKNYDPRANDHAAHMP